MVYFGVEEGSKAHRLYNPQTRKIVVSRDVVFEENVPWRWSAEFGENSEFAVEENVGETTQQYYGGNYGGDNHIDDLHDVSGGAPEHGDDDNDDDNHEQHHFDNFFENGEVSMQQSSGTQSGTVDSQVSVGENSENVEAGSDQVLSDDNMDIDHDDGPVRFRSIYEVYEEAAEVDLVSDSDIEVNALLTVMEEPTCYQEAANDENWRAAMDSELQSINKNKTWSLVNLPAGHKSIGLKWVFKLKRNAEGEIVKHKARLVAKGYVQKQGIDYDEVFAPVARLDTVRLLMAMSAN
jgi:hypothetical protein